MIYNVQLSEHHFPRLDAKANAIPNIEFFRTYDIVEKFTLHQHFVVASSWLYIHVTYVKTSMKGNFLLEFLNVNREGYISEFLRFFSRFGHFHL